MGYDFAALKDAGRESKRDMPSFLFFIDHFPKEFLFLGCVKIFYLKLLSFLFKKKRKFWNEFCVACFGWFLYIHLVISII